MSPLDLCVHSEWIFSVFNVTVSTADMLKASITFGAYTCKCFTKNVLDKKYYSETIRQCIMGFS